MGWSHIHVWWLRIGRVISAPHQGPQPKAPVPGRGISHNKWLWKSVVRWRATGYTGVLLKSLSTDSFTHKHSKLQKKDRSSKSARNTWGGTKLSGCKARVEVQFCEIEVPAGTIFLLLSFPSQPAGADEHHILVSIYLVNVIVSPPWWFPALPNSPTWPNLFQRLIHIGGHPVTVLWIFLKSLKVPKQVVAGLSMPCILFSSPKRVNSSQPQFTA